MKLFRTIGGIGLAVAFFFPAVTEAATCATATGPMAIERFVIGSNPVCSGQNLTLVVISRNCTSGQTVNVRRTIDVYDGTGQFLLSAFDFQYTSTLGIVTQLERAIPTAGAPAFSGKVRVTDFVAGQISDVVELPLVIVPPCPTLPPPIPPYAAGDAVGDN